ncbi:MAG: cytochrome P450, partial [Acidimicrobiales bacterium]
MARTSPVSDWSVDFDVLDAGYIADPFSVWDVLRRSCPIAHSQRRGSTWLPTRYQDVTAIAHDIDHFSSLEVAVIPFDGDEPEEPILPYGLPPISADPPLHTWTRRLLLPWFSHARVDGYEEMTRQLCRSLIDGFVADGRADAAADYAQQIPVRVIARILGVSDTDSDLFTGWVRDVLEFADDPDRRAQGVEGLLNYFLAEIERRREQPGDDLLSMLLHTEVDGTPVEQSVVLGTAALVLIAGVDTTWSAIGSSLWHLAAHG